MFNKTHNPNEKSKKIYVLIVVAITLMLVFAFFSFVCISFFPFIPASPTPSDKGSSFPFRNQPRETSETSPAYKPLPPLFTPFPHKERVTVKELMEEIKKRVRVLSLLPSKKYEFSKFAKKYNLNPTEKLYFQYVKATLMYEAATAEGFWNIQSQITDEEPCSDKIWEQWQNKTGEGFENTPTAIAECDEIGALYSVILNKMDMEGVGLFWPDKGHAIACWKLKSQEGKDVRILIPTTQYLWDEGDLFDSNGFDPFTQKVIYDYNRKDVGDSFSIPVGMARFFILQIDKYGSAHPSTLHKMRQLKLLYFYKEINLARVVHDGEFYLRQFRDEKQSQEDVWAWEYFVRDFSPDKTGTPGD